MPKDTFSRLPEEKKNRIIDAAKKEFTISSYQEASINKIIKNAGIPRGSFYQYFEDKRDLFIYVIGLHMDEILKRFSEDLAKKDGDFFACLYEYAEHIIQHATTETARFAKAVMMDNTVFTTMWEGLFVGINQEPCLMGKEITSAINMDLLDIQSEEEFKYFREIVGCVIRETVSEAIIMGEALDTEEFRKSFYGRLRSLEKHYQKTK